jgi:hypothetical protein
MTENQWAELRQVGFATLDHPAAVRAAPSCSSSARASAIRCWPPCT